jgi:uncharacterized NAD(P)/FAD-binding protein YdhS
MGIRITVIGGGAAAALVITELLDHGVGAPAELLCFSGYRGGSRGIAYGTPVDDHLLNVRATAMGLNSHDPTEFLDFARERLPDARASDFLPRRLYGDYLEARVARALENASFRGVRVSRVRSEITSIEPIADDRCRLVDDAGATHEADIVVLAIGALPPRALPQVDPSLIASGRYVLDPWQWLGANEVAVERLRRVVIVGSGLSAVDVALTMTERSPRLNVVMLSRRGRLPAAHVRESGIPAIELDALTQELLDRPDVAAWTRLLRNHCVESDDWRSVIDSVRHVVPTLWDALDDTQRRRVLRHLRWAWDGARHRMPPQVARRMVELQADRRLGLAAGRIVSIRPNRQQRPVVAYTAAPAFETRLENADVVVQATGMETDARGTNHSLVRSLLESGLARADPLGLGLVTDADGRLIGERATISPVLALGAMRRGMQWESTAIPEIRQQARRIALQIARHCANPPAATVAMLDGATGTH